MVKLFILSTFLLLTACPSTNDQAAPPDTTIQQSDIPTAWHIEISTYVSRYLPLLNTATDIKDWCSGYDTSIKPNAFWTNLLIRIIYYESGFNPDSTYKEANGVDSIGLFQLSVPDDLPTCDHKTPQQLKDPINNIHCAVPLFAKLVERDHIITAGYNNKTALGSAKYWATMRGGTYPGHVVDTIKKEMRVYCGDTTTSGK